MTDQQRPDPAAPQPEAGRPIRPRHVFGGLPRYAAGKPPRVVEGLRQYKLSSNENPLGPVPAVRRALAQYDAATHLYPDPLTTRLRTALSDSLGVPAEDIVAGAGSYGALTQIVSAFAGQSESGEPDEVVYAWRSFEAYPIIVGLGGARSVQVPLLATGEHDLDAMADAIGERTRVVLLCSPNNPTGPALTVDRVEAFMARVPRDVVVVLDEAYLEFCEASELTRRERAEGGLAEGVELYRRHPNLVVLRTFSKAAGLAGLRVGYSISQQEITRTLRVAATPFAVSSLAEACAVAAVEHPDEIAEQVGWIVAERERVVAGLREIGWDVPLTRANFVWLALGERSAEFAAFAEENALAVRAFHPEGVRVSIGEEEANTRLLELCARFPGRPGGSAPAGR